MATTVYRIPKVFFDDHTSRDAGVPDTVIVKTLSKSYDVELTNDQFDELISDARYYSNTWQFDRELHGLCSSAKATLRSLVKTQGASL
jgi:hypothetical protein